MSNGHLPGFKFTGIVVSTPAPRLIMIDSDDPDFAAYFADKVSLVGEFTATYPRPAGDSDAPAQDEGTS